MGSRDPEPERCAEGAPEDRDRIGEEKRRRMAKPRVVISLGLVAVVAISIWMSLVSNPIAGIASFFGLTGLLWAVARIKHWI
jgi:hypothetical protein